MEKPSSGRQHFEWKTHRVDDSNSSGKPIEWTTVSSGRLPFFVNSTVIERFVCSCLQLHFNQLSSTSARQLHRVDVIIRVEGFSLSVYTSVIEGFVCSFSSASFHSVFECSRSPIASRDTSLLIESNAEFSPTPTPCRQHPCPGCSARIAATRTRVKKLITTLVRVDSLFCLLLEQPHQDPRHLIPSQLRLKQKDLFHHTVPTELLALVEETNASLRLHKS